MLEGCKAEVYSCENATDYNFNIIGNKKPPEAYSDSPLRFVKMKEMKPISPTGRDCTIVAFLAMSLSASIGVCVRSGRCVFACILSSTDISSNVADISRGFEDLIPSVFEEL